MTQTPSPLSQFVPINTAGEDVNNCCAADGEGAACCGRPGAFQLGLTELDADKLANIFKALGNPVRLQIVELLSRYSGQVCVCDIEDQFDLSQPTISHHLKVLRQAGVVDGEQRGLWVHYFLRQDTLDLLRNIIDAIYARSSHA